MKTKFKILRRTSAVMLAVIILCISMLPAFAATSWDEGARGVNPENIFWKSTFTYKYTDAKGNERDVKFTMGTPLGVYYFSKKGETMVFSNKAQRAFCIEPEKHTGPIQGTSRYNRDQTLSDVYAYSSRLTTHQQRMLNYTLASGYGSYVPTSSVAYWYATQLLIFEIVSGMRNYYGFTLNPVGSMTNGLNPSDVLTTYSGYTPETSISTIQSAYDNMVEWMKLATSDPSGVSSNEADAPVYQMEYKDGKYTYTYNDTNNIIRTAYKDADYDGKTIKRSAMNFTSNDLTISDPNVKAEILDKSIVFTSDKPLSGEVLVSLNNARQRGLKEMAQIGYNEGNTKIAMGEITIAESKDNNKSEKDRDQAFARGASPVVTTRYFKLATVSQKLRLQKTSGCTAISENNKMYSLEGAKFDIYTDEAMTKYFGSITTDKNGVGIFGEGEGTDVPVQNYYAKEVVAPKNFRINTNGGKPFVFTDSGQKAKDGTSIYSFTCADIPYNDPMYVFIKKVDAISGRGNADLAGAQFEVKYYDGIYRTAEEITAAGAQPQRSWVFRTDDNGSVEYHTDYKVSGDDLYTGPTGRYVLPLGTVTIKEIAEPTSGKYLLNDQMFIKVIDDDVTVSEDQYPTDEEITVAETPHTSGLTIKKTSDDGRVANIWFKVESDNGFSGQYETNRLGVLNVEDLDITNTAGEKINYTITELGIKRSDGSISIPKKYEPEELTKTITLEDGDNVVTFHNKVNLGELVILKKSEDNQVSNLYFKVSDSSGKVNIVRATGEDGKLSVKNLSIYDDDDNFIAYTVEELGFKTGNNEYVVPKKYFNPTPRTVVFRKAFVDITFENALVKGGIAVTKSCEDGNVSDIYFSVRSKNTGYEFEAIDKTDSEGKVTFENLRAYDDGGNEIEYEVTELGYYDEATGEYVVPTTYFTPESQSTKISSGKTTELEFINVPKKFNIKVKKTASDNVIEGIKFSVTGSNGCYYEKATDKDGYAFFGKLDIYDTDNQVITYEVSEVGTPARYRLVAPQNVSGEDYVADVSGEIKTSELTFSNQEYLGGIRIHKNSEDGVVDQIWFRVEGDNGYTKDKATGKDGYVSFDGLKVFGKDNEKVNYTITELGIKQDDGTYKVPFRYVLTNPQTISLEKNETTDREYADVEFNNTLKKGSIKVIKLDESDNPIESVSFELYKADNSFVASAITTEKGEAIFEDLDLGEYYIVETQTDVLHNLLSTMVKVAVSGESQEALNPTKTIKNTLKPFIIEAGGNNGIIAIAIGGALVLITCVGIVVYIIHKKKK